MLTAGTVILIFVLGREVKQARGVLPTRVRESQPGGAGTKS